VSLKTVEGKRSTISLGIWLWEKVCIVCAVVDFTHNSVLIYCDQMVAYVLRSSHVPTICVITAN
jgi:hypothetical protein